MQDAARLDDPRIGAKPDIFRAWTSLFEPGETPLHIRAESASPQCLKNVRLEFPPPCSREIDALPVDHPMKGPVRDLPLDDASSFSMTRLRLRNQRHDSSPMLDRAAFPQGMPIRVPVLGRG